MVLDGIGGSVALGSYRALRRGGRLVMYGHYDTTISGRKSARRIAVFYLSGALVFAGNLLPAGKQVLVFQVAKLRDRQRGRTRIRFSHPRRRAQLSPYYGARCVHTPDVGSR